MSDLHTSERTADAVTAQIPLDASSSTVFRDGVRLDPPHQLGGNQRPEHAIPPAPATSPAASDQDAYDVVGEPGADVSASASGMRFPYGDPLLQARQIAEHLQRRYSELEHRERRLSVQLAQLDQERRSVRMWVTECEAVLQQRDNELIEREQGTHQREQACLSLEHDLQTQKAEVLVREKELQDIKDLWRAEWERERAVLQQEIDQKWVELQNDQESFRQTRETQLAEIAQDRTLQLNRIRFQEEHLQKLRRDFEAAQNAFHAEKQRIQSHLTEMELQQHRRQTQLEQYCQVLEERDSAVQRQMSLLAKTRKAGVDSLTQDHQRLMTEQKEWQLVREKQQKEMTRQAEMLRLNAENLEARQKRLEQVQQELEETNRRTLEMRLVVEAACAQLAQAVGPEAAKQRIEAAQRALSEHYKKARDQILNQRKEVEQFRTTVQTQRDEFRTEQQNLADWVTKRDNDLKLREAAVRQEQIKFVQREQAWQNAKEKWMLEKLEAEGIIRDLLKRLEGQTAGQ